MKDKETLERERDAVECFIPEAEGCAGETADRLPEPCMPKLPERYAGAWDMTQLRQMIMCRHCPGLCCRVFRIDLPVDNATGRPLPERLVDIVGDRLAPSAERAMELWRPLPGMPPLERYGRQSVKSIPGCSVKSCGMTCTALGADGMCTVYDSRPDTCVTYVCGHRAGDPMHPAMLGSLRGVSSPEELADAERAAAKELMDLLGLCGDRLPSDRAALDPGLPESRDINALFEQIRDMIREPECRYDREKHVRMRREMMNLASRCWGGDAEQPAPEVMPDGFVGTLLRGFPDQAGLDRALAGETGTLAAWLVRELREASDGLSADEWREQAVMSLRAAVDDLETTLAELDGGLCDL